MPSDRVAFVLIARGGRHLAMGTRLDGTSTAPSTLTRYRSALSHCLRCAVAEEVIEANPAASVVQSKRTAGASGPRAVDRNRLPSLQTALQLIDAIAATGRQGARYACFFLVILLGGLRPSEVAQLHVEDLTLPDEGWGSIKVWGATVVAGRRYTNVDASWEDGSQKWRREEAPPREVPIPPRLVRALVDHLDTYGASADGRVFVNTLGNPLTPNNTGDTWRIARAGLWPKARAADGKALPPRRQRGFWDLKPYDLRHVQASLCCCWRRPK